MNRLYILLISCILLVGCNSTKDVAYLQNLDINKQESISASKGITIQPKDVLSIIVSCKDAELAAMFNLPVVSYQTNSEIVSSTGGTQQLLGYAVDENGEIKLPVLGKMKVAGMTRWEVQEKIKSELKSRELLKDMVVTVEFRNFKISILGEVKNPGSYSIEGDKVNVLEAISMAGDLTIYGLRDQVYVIREEGGERTVYRLNLKSAEVFRLLSEAERRGLRAAQQGARRRIEPQREQHEVYRHLDFDSLPAHHRSDARCRGKEIMT